GSAVKLVVLSKGAEKNVSVTLGELPNVTEARAEPTEPGTPNMRRRRDRDPEFQRGPERDDRDELRGDRGRDNRDGPRSERRRDRDDRGDLRGDREDRGNQ